MPIMSTDMAITADFTYGGGTGKFQKRRVPKKLQAPKQKPSARIPTSRLAKDVELTTPTQKQNIGIDSFWHMGTQQKTHKEPDKFTWAFRVDTPKGGLDFGLKLSGSDMPFTKRGRIFF